MVPKQILTLSLCRIAKSKFVEGNPLFQLHIIKALHFLIKFNKKDSLSLRVGTN